MSTKIFCDIADIKTIKKFTKKRIVKGFTTNPSLIRKAGAKDYLNYCRKILQVSKNKPVSLEVFADNYHQMKKQALILNNLGKNVYVKIPVCNSKGNFSGKIVNFLSNNKVKLNITAVYTAVQTKKILKVINKKSDIIISIFIGRASDAGKDPLPELLKSIKLAKKFKKVKILWASVREPYNYLHARKMGCHIITVPPNIIEKIESFGKSYNKLTLETVKTFISDSRKSKFKI